MFHGFKRYHFDISSFTVCLAIIVYFAWQIFLGLVVPGLVELRLATVNYKDYLLISSSLLAEREPLCAEAIKGLGDHVTRASKEDKLVRDNSSSTTRLV